MKFYSMSAIILCLGMTTLVYAQDTQDTQEVPRPVAEETAGPAHLGAEAPALAIDTDLEVRNLLVAGFSLGGVYDNEGLYHSGVAPYYSSDARYFVQPSIGFQRTFSTGTLDGELHAGRQHQPA